MDPLYSMHSVKKHAMLLIQKMKCDLFLTMRRQNYADVLGLLATGGVHSRQNHSFDTLRLVS